MGTFLVTSTLLIHSKMYYYFWNYKNIEGLML